GSMFSIMFGIEDDDNSEMVVVTNSNMAYGASALFYDGVMNRVADRIGGSYYVLPSSVHEVICVPAYRMEWTDLQSMVRNINDTVVSDEDVLSDNVYYYDADTGALLKAYEKYLH
ncbi:MAG: hypothetical protein IJJ44_12570, partial [Solobacterium sp.]|nr:hypothetical protein [Solobacterium sp.]